MAPIVPFIPAIIGLVAEGGKAVAANQASQSAKGVAGTLLTQQKAQPFNEESANSKTAAIAKTRALGAAATDAGQGGTILTGPQGAPASNSPRKTLLGL